MRLQAQPHTREGVIRVDTLRRLLPGHPFVGWYQSGAADGSGESLVLLQELQAAASEWAQMQMSGVDADAPTGSSFGSLQIPEATTGVHPAPLNLHIIIVSVIR